MKELGTKNADPIDDLTHKTGIRAKCSTHWAAWAPYSLLLEIWIVFRVGECGARRRRWSETLMAANFTKNELMLTLYDIAGPKGH